MDQVLEQRSRKNESKGPFEAARIGFSSVWSFEPCRRASVQWDDAFGMSKIRHERVHRALPKTCVLEKAAKTSKTVDARP